MKTPCATTDCGHGRLAHRYLCGSGSNSGECLAPQCWCDGFEEGE